MPSHDPIGVFDSGFGGLTVLKELQKALPNESFIYLGDTAHLPYGTKSPETILRYTQQGCAFLKSQGVKLIVIACNTATAILPPSPSIIGVIDPVISQIAPTSHIGILGTRATIASGVYQSKLPPSTKITAVAAPLLVSLVEEGFIDHPITHLAIQEYIQHLAHVDTLILACTHFPLLKELIQKALGPTVHIIDPAIATALATAKALQQNLSPCASPTRFYVTDDPGKFARLGPQFLGSPIEEVKRAEVVYA